MINWHNRRTLKQARELLHAARKLARIHADVLDARRAQEVAAACADLQTAVAARNVTAIPGLSDRLDKQLARAFPRLKHAGVRENIEVFLVAALVAMGVRTFFIQPFKIPTGSMQPTLYGIHEDPNCPPTSFLPKRLLDLALFGVASQNHYCTVHGDHIFVDKVSYHFRKPNRGEVVVFDTGHIADLPERSRGKFYIKRLIGLAGDHIQIQEPYVLVNGRILDERKAFRRIYSRENGYDGYVLPEPNTYPPPKYFRSADQVYQVPDGHFFVMGDNSRHSLDGRYWGSVPEPDLVGRALFVYWPFSRRLGRID